jgi:hypothetical protein
VQEIDKAYSEIGEQLGALTETIPLYYKDPIQKEL